MNGRSFSLLGLLYGMGFILALLNADSTALPSPDDLRLSQLRPDRDAVAAMLRAALQGDWYGVNVEGPGAKGIQHAILSDGKVLTWSSAVTGLRFSEGTFVTDPTVSPRAMDVTFTAGGLKGLTLHGIFRLRGTWEAKAGKCVRNVDIRLASPGHPRPLTFDDNDGTTTTITFNR